MFPFFNYDHMDGFFKSQSSSPICLIIFFFINDENPVWFLNSRPDFDGVFFLFSSTITLLNQKKKSQKSYFCNNFIFNMKLKLYIILVFPWSK